MSDDGQTLYASLEGSATVRRFNAATRTPGSEFQIGQDTFQGIYIATDIAVAPGNPDLVAVARSKRGVSPPQAGVAVFDNGVQRPTTGPGHSLGSDNLSFSASASTLYGSGFNGALATMSINSSGVTQTNAVSFPGVKIRFDNGRVYGSAGHIIDPVSGTLIGTFPGLSGVLPFTTDSAVGRAYYLTGSQQSLDYSITIRAFDINTFLQVGSLTIPGINGEVRSLIRWGSNGLAFSTEGGQLFVIQTSLIPSADPIPTPTPTPFPTPFPEPTLFPTFIRQVPLINNDIAYSPSTGLFYASVPSTAGSSGNSIQSINPETGALGSSVFIGSEPTKLAMSDDNQTLYVALEGAASARKYNVVSQTATPQFSLAFGSGVIGPLFPNDLAVEPGNPNAVAVSRANRFSSPDSDGVAIYDNGVPRPNVAHINTFEVEYSNTPDKLYSFGFSGGVDRLSADASGAQFLSNIPTINGGRIRFDNGLVYGSRGGVVDPITGLMKGSFTGLDFFDSIMTTDVPNGRAYFLTTNGSSANAVLRAYDLNTFIPLGSVSFPIPSSPFNSSVSTLIRWGTNGLAFRHGSHVVFIQSSLVSNSGVVPTPTPTPSPSPSPTPTPYVPTFVRQINLQTKDLAYVSSSGQIYASVPGTAGPNGNSITRINPQTGTIGESVFIGSEPNKVALSDDGTTLHVSLDGAAAIRSYNIPTQTPGTQFSWGSINQRPVDMAVVPGNPLALAIPGPFSNTVTIYDNGVPRPNSSSGGVHGIGSIAFTSPTVMYGFDNGSSGFQLVKYTVDANGVNGTVIASHLVTGFGNRITAAGGLLYSRGRIVDPEARSIKGTLSNNENSFTVDTALGRVFLVTTFNGAATIRAFDINTFVQLGSVTFPGVTGTPVRIVRWGVNGLAFNTTDSSDPTASKIYVVQSALVSDQAAIPTGIQLTADKFFTSENSSNLTVTVTRSGDISGATSVDYATSNGTATGGTDYTSASGTLNFAAGQLTKTVTIPILNDQIFEGPAETFSFTLSNTSGASLEAPSVAQITIADNEVKPSIFASSVNATEGNSGTKIFSVPVTLTNASVDQISINYTTANGSATAGSDYVTNSGVLTFAPGTSTASIDITVNGDNTIESDETFVVTFTNPLNASNAPSQVTLTIANDDSTIQFGSATYSIAETGGSLTVTVNRAGEVSGSSVEYTTTDVSGANNCSVTNGGASSRCDYITTLGTFTFAPGETTKSISIPIVDDAYAEGSETFNIAFVNPVGMTTSSPTATITITDDDVTNGTQNPSDIPLQFVRQHYIDFLNREPDSSGLAFWTNEITSCGSNNQCVEVKRINVSGAFFLSIEFQETGYFVYRVMKSAFGNPPGSPVPVTFTSFLKDTQLIGQGVQVNVGNWQQQLATNKQAYTLAMVQSEAFLAQFPNTVTAQQFVNQLNDNAGGVLTQTQIASFANFLAGAPTQASRRATVLGLVADNATLRSNELNKAFVLMQYFGYLRRNPNDAPDADFSGFNFWLNKLDSFGGKFTDAEMVKAFITSIEYRQRFAP
jgi:Calx-beta domain